jgi:hypothetical protein
VAGVVQDRHRDRGEPGSDLAVLDGVAAASALDEQPAQCGERAGADVVAGDERVGLRVQGPDLRRGERGEHRPPARREMRGQSHPHVGDQGWASGRALLDEVHDLPPVQDGQVRGVPGPVDEPAERYTRDALQRGLADVAGAELVGGHAEAEAPFVGQVDDEPALRQRREQLVRGGPGQFQIAGDRGGGHRPGLAGEVAEDRERLLRGGHLHRDRHPQDATSVRDPGQSGCAPW